MYAKLGTLGNSSSDVTCSILAAKSMNTVNDIIAFEQFEMAADAVISREIDAMLVPCAYPKVGSFIMDHMLHVAETYLYAIPSLVFASTLSEPHIVYEVMYNHAATNHLLSETGALWHEHQNVNSNTTACTEVINASEPCCAITNEACARKYGLQIHKVLRDKINMPFIIFISAEMEGKRVG